MLGFKSNDVLSFRFPFQIRLYVKDWVVSFLTLEFQRFKLVWANRISSNSEIIQFYLIALKYFKKCNLKGSNDNCSCKEILVSRRKFLSLSFFSPRRSYELLLKLYLRYELLFKWTK